MKKEKFHKQRKYFSLVLVPHFPGKVRVLKLSSLHSKLASLAVLVMTIIACSLLIVSDIVHDNRLFRTQLAEVETLNANQIGLLNEKVREINNLKANKETIDKLKQDFADKYREIIEKYISDSIATSRSGRNGNRSTANFASDIKELRLLLNYITEMSTVNEDYRIDLSDAEQKLLNYMASLPTQWPASGPISSKFGTRTDPLLGSKATHKGIDIGAQNKSDILAAGSGTVTFVGILSGYGNTVIISHGSSISTLYGHASKLLVKNGQTVSKGEVIAKVGSSGRSTGPHLHFEIRLNDSPVDPLYFLEQK